LRQVPMFIPVNCMTEPTLYFSDLAHDAGLAEIIELFVGELPGRVDAMRQAVKAGDLALVGRLAHQLKGAGGSHGFPHLSKIAWEVERAARELCSSSEASAALNRLAEACAKTRAGNPTLTSVSK
jgi:HPt (histidine-containing phosphotransfer) domain-containing protein